MSDGNKSSAAASSLFNLPTFFLSLIFHLDVSCIQTYILMHVDLDKVAQAFHKQCVIFCFNASVVFPRIVAGLWQ